MRDGSPKPTPGPDASPRDRLSRLITGYFASQAVDVAAEGT